MMFIVDKNKNIFPNTTCIYCIYVILPTYSTARQKRSKPTLTQLLIASTKSSRIPLSRLLNSLLSLSFSGLDPKRTCPRRALEAARHPRQNYHRNDSGCHAGPTP